jgi:hypothetical protein
MIYKQIFINGATVYSPALTGDREIVFNFPAGAVASTWNIKVASKSDATGCAPLLSSVTNLKAGNCFCPGVAPTSPAVDLLLSFTAAGVAPTGNQIAIPAAGGEYRMNLPWCPDQLYIGAAAVTGGAGVTVFLEGNK